MDAFLGKEFSCKLEPISEADCFNLPNIANEEENPELILFENLLDVPVAYGTAFINNKNVSLLHPLKVLRNCHKLAFAIADFSPQTIDRGVGVCYRLF